MEWEPVAESDKPQEKSSRRRLVWLVVLAVAVLGAVVVFAGGDDEGESVASGPTTTTTAAATNTTEAPFDFLPTCAAQARFRTAAMAMETSRDPKLLREALDVMIVSLRSLQADRAHPELIEQVERVQPIVEEANLELEGVEDAEVLDALAQDPRFSSAEAREVMGNIFTYPLRCPAS